MIDRAQTTPILTNAAFAGYAARLAQKSAAWAADTIGFGFEPAEDPMSSQATARYLKEMRQLLDHMERQVQP